MSRKPPVITTIYMQSDGSLHLEWDLDRFFQDPELPDGVWVWIDGTVGELMPGDTTSFDIPAAVLTTLAPVTAIVGSVVFKWNGPPDETQASAFTYPATGAVPGHLGEAPTVPTVRLVSRGAKTLRRPNQITIAWDSYSYNSGAIIWGPPSSPRSFTHEFKPHGSVYSGQFTTDQPLTPRSEYVFLVQVTNSFHGRTVKTAITVGSEANIASLRRFLIESEVPPQTPLRELLPDSQSLRALLGV